MGVGKLLRQLDKRDLGPLHPLGSYASIGRQVMNIFDIETGFKSSGDELFGSRSHSGCNRLDLHVVKFCLTLFLFSLFSPDAYFRDHVDSRL